MNKIKEIILKIKENYLKLSPMTREVIETIVFVVGMVILIRFFIFEIRWIPSASMHPTLIEGDRIIIERTSRFYSVPKRGDVMVFYPPFVKLSNNPVKLFSRLTGFFCRDIAYIKRVIGTPGDKFELKTDKDGKSFVYINDKKLNEKYILTEYYEKPCDNNMLCGPLIIPDHMYLMMGDNRGDSYDSRWWGLLPEDRFIGKAVFILWPFDRIKILH